LASLALAFDILARDKASPTFKKVGDSVDRTAGKVTNLGGKFTNLGKVAAIGLGAAAVGAVALGKSFVDAAIESQKVTKQTEAVLKSMGDVAGVSADQVAEMSAQLSLQSGIDDELIQSSQNVLLTFGKVQNKVGKGNKIFDRATKAALDMSVALGTDMQGATIQVGKALNDPIKGITALSRAGVSFTQKQKDTIKSLVEQGKVLDAQKIILGELEKQFGGSAAAQATAGDRLKVVWGNLQEELGMRLLPVVERVAEWLGNVLPPALDALAGFLQPVIDQVGLFWGALSSGKTEDEGTPIESVALAVRDAFEALKVWWDENGETIKTTVGGVIGSIKDTLVTVATTIKETLLPKLQEFGAWHGDRHRGDRGGDGCVRAERGICSGRDVDRGGAVPSGRCRHRRSGVGGWRALREDRPMGQGQRRLQRHHPAPRDHEQPRSRCRRRDRSPDRGSEAHP
jgi:phage-related minor tail protein